LFIVLDASSVGAAALKVASPAELLAEEDSAG
jgi:hypothetical protein